MKGLGNLVKNELIKTGKAVYFKVFVILILVVSIALPTGYFINDKIEEKRKNDTAYREDEYYYLDENVSPVLKAYYSCYSEASRFFSDNSIPKDDWRYEEYFEVYALYYCARAKAFDELSKGSIAYSEIESYFYSAMYSAQPDANYYSNPYIKYNLSDLLAITEKPDIPETNEDGDPFTYEGLSKEEYVKLRDQAQRNKENVAKYIKSASIVKKYENLVKVAQDEVKTAKQSLDDAQTLYNKTKTLDDKKALTDAKAMYESKNVLLWGYQQLLNGKYEVNDWHYSEIKKTLAAAANALSSNIIYDEDIYKRDYADYYKSYHRYVLPVEPAVKAANNAINAVKYSFEKNIPISGNESKSASEYLTSQIKIINVVICLLMIVMAGTTMSNEFMSGSIRLLLVRPRSRSKILLSKILSVFIYGAGLMLISFVIMSALNTGLCETKNLFAKTVMVNFSGNAYAILPVVLALFKCILSLFSVNVMVSFSIFLSVLFTKGGVLAVALANMVQIADVFANELFNEINIVFNGLLEYTPVPYLEMSFYLENPVDYNALQSGYSASLQTVFNPIIGAVVVTICSAVFYMLAFLIFKKKQIKN